MKNLQGGAAQLPFLAIFPAGRPEEVIRLGPAPYTRSQLIAALERAGKSMSVGTGTFGDVAKNGKPPSVVVSDVP